MEEYTQITLTEWLSWKEDIRQKLQETAGNFVHIGYRLKQIRDSGMFDGCQDIFEFAQKEYGLSKSTVSRFIAINEKFSEGGNSLELRAEFRGIGSSKLSEMLTLPDADCRLITERTTVKEIRELKEFNRQEPPADALEGASESCCDVATESPSAIVNTEAEADLECDAKTESSVSYTPLQKCIIDFFKAEDRKQVLCQIMDILTGEATEDGLKAAAEAMNPGDYCTHKKGMVFLFMYDWQQGVKYKLMTMPEPVSITWPEILREIQDIYLQAYIDSPEDVWGRFYKKAEQRGEETGNGEERESEERAGGTEGTGKETEGQQEPEQQVSESERKYREQVLSIAQEIQARIHSAGERPLLMEDVRSAHAAARKLTVALDRLYDIKEHEQGELEGQMTIEDMRLTE